MTLYSQRIGYQTDRILVPSARVLSPQFNQAVVCLSGAQIEILRNLVDYANRIETFVASYGDTYYVTPDGTDWDAISASVADLEEKLMGNDNTIWGFNSVLWTLKNDVVTTAGTWDQEHTTVPDGEVWVVNGVSWFSDTAPGSIAFFALLPSSGPAVVNTTGWTVNKWAVSKGLGVVLAAGDHLRARWGATVVGQSVLTSAWGYKMKVPE